VQIQCFPQRSAKESGYAEEPEKESMKIRFFDKTAIAFCKNCIGIFYFTKVNCLMAAIDASCSVSLAV
jgi:hypothetical protein